MDPYRYFIFNQKSVLILGVLQVACAGLCVVCGFMDAAFRKDTPLSTTRAPVWGGLIMACPGLLALLTSQRKIPVLVTMMVAAAGLSCTASLFVSAYSCLTFTYGEEDQDIFHHHSSLKVTFVLHRMVMGANAAILLSCGGSLAVSCVIAYVGCRSLPCCACYDNRTGLEMLVPQSESSGTELVSTWRGGDTRLFNSQAQAGDQVDREEEERSSKLPPYRRLS